MSSDLIIEEELNSELNGVSASLSPVSRREGEQSFVPNYPDVESSSPLQTYYEALKYGDEDTIKKLVNMKLINCNSREGGLGLLVSAKEGYVGIARILAEGGADLEVKTSDGKTSFHIAVDEGNYSVAETLLDLGADINSKTNAGVTPLMRAALGRMDLVKLLLDRGADYSAKTKCGETALYYAYVEKHKDIVAVLRSRGAKK